MSDENDIVEQDLNKFEPEFLRAKFCKLVESEGHGNPNSGICLSSRCDFTVSNIESDEKSGHCKICETNTVCAWFYLVPLDNTPFNQPDEDEIEEELK